VGIFCKGTRKHGTALKGSRYALPVDTPSVGRPRFQYVCVNKREIALRVADANLSLRKINSS